MYAFKQRRTEIIADIGKYWEEYFRHICVIFLVSFEMYFEKIREFIPYQLSDVQLSNSRCWEKQEVYRPQEK